MLDEGGAVRKHVRSKQDLTYPEPLGSADKLDVEEREGQLRKTPRFFALR